MSVWTHVNASLRIICLRIVEDCLTKDDIEVFLENNVPHGSEGGLTYQVYANPKLNHLSAFTVNIFGGLRDFYRKDCVYITEFLDNFIEFLKDNESSLEQGVVEIDPEDDDDIFVLLYYYDTGFKVVHPDKALRGAYELLQEGEKDE